MTEAEKLAEAYFTLGMKPGGSKEAVHSRWKRLAMVWHSDRFTSEESKREADEELKNINNARDILKKHFETSHKASGPCACNTTSGSAGPSKQAGTGQGPGPGKRRTTQETDKEEAEAARRNKERAERAAKAAGEKSAQEAKAAAEAAAAERAKQNAEQTATVESEKLRWKIALCMAAAWIVLSFSGFCLTSVKVWWTHLSEKWDQERRWKADEEEQKKAAAKAAADQAQRDQEQAEADQKRRDAEDQERKNQSIASANAAIKQQQDIIDHCNSELSKIQSQLDDPLVAYSEKIKLRGYQGQNQNWLARAQANYDIAQQQLADATGKPAPPPIGGKTDTPVPHIDKLSDTRPPVNINDIPSQVDQPPAQKFTDPHWNPKGQPTRPNDPLLPSIYK